MDPLVHVETQERAQPYFNLMDTHSYVSPDVWEALGYATQDSQAVTTWWYRPCGIAKLMLWGLKFNSKSNLMVNLTASQI